MADNVTLPGTGETVRTDDIGGVQYQIVKLAVGADGVADLVSDSYPVPVGTRARGRTPINFEAAFSASQTASTLYTPTSGKKLCCTHITVSATGAGTLTLFDNSDAAGSHWSPILNLLAGGGWDAHFSDDNPLVMSAADNVLKYTSGSGATGSIWLHGWEE